MRSLNLSMLLTLSTVIWPRLRGCLVKGQLVESANMACTSSGLSLHCWQH